MRDYNYIADDVRVIEAYYQACLIVDPQSDTPDSMLLNTVYLQRCPVYDLRSHCHATLTRVHSCSSSREEQGSCMARMARITITTRSFRNLFSSRADACGDSFSPSALMCEESVSDKQPGSFHVGVKTGEIMWSWCKQDLAHSVSHRILCKNATGEPVSSDSKSRSQPNPKRKR